MLRRIRRSCHQFSRVEKRFYLTFSLKRHIIHVHVITLHLVIYSASSTGVTEGRENMSPQAKRAELTAKKAEEAG